MGIANRLRLLQLYAQMDQLYHQGLSIKQLQALSRIYGFRILIQTRKAVSSPHRHLVGPIISLDFNG